MAGFLLRNERAAFMRRFHGLVLALALILPAGCNKDSIEWETTGHAPAVQGEEPVPAPEAFLRTGPIGQGRYVLPNGRAVSPAGDWITVNRFPIDVEVSPDGRFAVVASTTRPRMTLVDTDAMTVQQVERPFNTFYGTIFNSAGDRFWVPGGGANKVYEYELVGGAAIPGREIPVQGYPAGIALSADEETLLIACNLGKLLRMIDLASGLEVGFIPTGLYPYDVKVHPSGTLAYVSNWGASSVSVLDLVNLSETHRIEVGKNPEGMALSQDGSRLFVTNSDSDTLSVIRTDTHEVAATYDLHDDSIRTNGASPCSVVVGPEDERIYVACSGYNAVFVVETSTGAILGRIPTGWYPSDIALDPIGNRLYVTSGKGVGSWSGSNGWPGVLSSVAVPDDEELIAHTTATDQNHLWSDNFYQQTTISSPVPDRWGQPSRQIKHVIFVLKENKTYDQLLGDLEGTEADPAHLVFGEAVTPNLHALARAFSNCDNFYVEGDTSILGHFWGTAALCNDYAEKTWLAGGRYPLSTIEEAAKPEGKKYIFNHCLDNGVEFRNYGQFVGVIDHLDRLAPYIDFKYGFWNMLHSDETKVDEIIREIELGIFPPIVYIVLPNDHTYGTSEGTPTPRWMVADNDAGLGKLVDYISHSPYWKETAIFVTQDDPQSGTDHIDPHRTVSLVISPWAKRDHNSSVLYTMSSIWRTIELILGLPPLSNFDRYAAPMFDCFTMEPDFTPYTAIPNPIPYEENEAGLPFQDYCNRANWSLPDQVGRLGEVLWATERPGEPFPYEYSVDREEESEEEEEEALEARQAMERLSKWLDDRQKSPSP